MDAPGGFLERLASADRDLLLGLGRECSFSPGDVLMTQGSPSDSVALLLSGAVRVVATTAGGTEVTLSVRAGGDLLGTLGALTVPPAPRAATVTAITTVRARLVATSAFLDLLARAAGVSFALLADLAGEWRAASRRHLEFGAYPAEQRLAALLVELSGRGDRRADLPLSQTDLAGMVGISRDSAARVLGRFRDEGLVSTGRKAIQVLDADGLRARAHPTS